MKSFIACLFLACLAFASATTWEECGSRTGEVKSLQVSDCPDYLDPDIYPCILQRGTRKDITIAFDSKTVTKNVTAVVSWIFDDVPLSFDLPKPDACAFGGLSCPLQNGKNYTFTHSLNISKSYPPLSVKVRWELKDSTKSNLVCLQFKSKIQ